MMASRFKIKNQEAKRAPFPKFYFSSWITIRTRTKTYFTLQFLSPMDTLSSRPTSARKLKATVEATRTERVKNIGKLPIDQVTTLRRQVLKGAFSINSLGSHHDNWEKKPCVLMSFASSTFTRSEKERRWWRKLLFTFADSWNTWECKASSYCQWTCALESEMRILWSILHGLFATRN